MSLAEICALLREQARLRAPENDETGLLIEAAAHIKSLWVQEQCTDKFEGIPCTYPHCTCEPSNRQEMESAWWDTHNKTEE